MIGAFFSPKIREEGQRVSCNRGIPAGGSSFNCSDLATARVEAKRTYEEGYKRGIASNHGDPEH